MEPKSYLKIIKPFFLLISSLLFSCHKAPQQKNVLFILADDFGYYDMSFRGSKLYETPNIDKLAKASMVFNNGYAASQICSPSRASILTGKSPARHGITDWIGVPTGADWRKKNRHSKLLPPNYNNHLPHQYTTLPEALKQKGYQTFFAGKWHLGGKNSTPIDHGFDINIGGYEAGHPRGGYFSPYKNPQLPDRSNGENLSMRLAKETSNFIKTHQDKNFFAFLSFYAVHGPIETTHKKWKKYQHKATKVGIQENGFKMGHFLPIRQNQDNPIYAGLVESMDNAIGEVLKTLKQTGADKNTIIIFTSDNGGVASGDAFATSNLPLRGGKGYQFEGGIKEPFFIKVPWLNTSSKQSNVPVINTDLYPTILDLTDIQLKPKEHTDGISLLPLLKNNTIADRPLIWHYPHYGNQGGEPSSIIRQGDWKLIYYYEDERKELYNLKNDIQETINLSTTNQTITKKLETTLFQYLNNLGAKYPTKDPLYDATLEATHLNNIATKKLAELEKKRRWLLNPNYNPKNNWWGSKQTKD